MRTFHMHITPSETLYTDSIDYRLGGALTLRNGRIDKYQFDEGYCQASASSSTTDNFVLFYYEKDHLGNVRQVRKVNRSRNGEVVQTNNYYPFGAELCDGNANTSVQLRKYNGKEFDRMHGLNTYDYGARQYNPVTARWDRIDPLAEKYYSASPYVYCMNNPVKFVDPDGRKVRPAGNAELVMIKNTIPYEARQYVVLDSDGYIDETTLNFYDGQSVNFSNLKELVASPRFIDVKLDDEFDFADKEGVVGHATMSYEPCNSETMDKNGEVSIGGLSTGESGFMGKTLFPDRDGYQNSTNSNIQVIVNKNLSHAGAAESYSHEANGHALLYVRNGGNHTGASHQPVGEGWTEGNMTLKKMIIDSKKATIKNMN